MNYTTSEALDEVLARRDRLRKKRERRRTAWYGLCVCAIIFALTLTVTSLPMNGEDASGAEVMGSFLLEAKTGGILTALILAFAVGVLAALLWFRKKKSKKTSESPRTTQHDENGGTKP